MTSKEEALRGSPQLPWIIRALAATILFLPLIALGAQDDAVPVEPAAFVDPATLYSVEELDNLLAPVALYPDPILAQILVAATFPEQIELAARYVRLNGDVDVDQQAWDISVRALAHYAPVLNLMADRIDWTTALGQAYVTQSGDVMASVQTLRTMARAQGNLVTTAQQEVVVRDRNIYIVPAQPRVVYVPTYDPLIIYYRPVVHVGRYRSGWSFGVGFPIGVWLTYGVDWHERHVYYHGWRDDAYRYGWYHRSRPYIVINNIYVNPWRTTVIINRRVVNRYIDYDRFDRYETVHRRVDWDRRRRIDDNRRRYADRGRDAEPKGPSWDRNNERPRTAVPRRVVAVTPRAAPPITERSRVPSAVPTAQRRTAPIPQRRAVPSTTQRRAVPSTTQRRAVPSTTQRRAVPSTTQRRAVPSTAQPRAVPSTQRRSAPSVPRAVPSSGQRRTVTPSRSPSERRAATPTPRTRSQVPAPRARQAKPARVPSGKASGAPPSGRSSARTATARTGKGRQPNEDR